MYSDFVSNNNRMEELMFEFILSVILTTSPGVKYWTGVKTKLSHMSVAELCQQKNIDLAYYTGVQLSLWSRTDKFEDKKYLSQLIFNKCGTVHTERY